jgi:hypothetical protein
LSAGCASHDRAVFVTKTSMGILDADTTPPSLTVAYDRTEGYYGPSYANGEAPPVAAIIQASNKVFNPQVRQLYATGRAANIVANKEQAAPEKAEELIPESRMMFFGTSVNVGIKFSFMADKPLPTGMIFGYKRKEASYIPLGVTDRGTTRERHHYPSVFASIDTSAKMREHNDGAFSVTQVFATGHAADHFAESQRDQFKVRAADALGEARSLDQKQRLAALEVIRSYNQLPAGDRPKAWTDADRLGLFHEKTEERGQAIAWLNDAANSAKADGYYTDAIARVNVDDSARLRLLELHLDNINRLAKP